MTYDLYYRKWELRRCEPDELLNETGEQKRFGHVEHIDNAHGVQQRIKLYADRETIPAWLGEFISKKI